MAINFTISGIQRVILYETKARFYIVGSNNIQSRFRVLNIHRTEAKELVIIDDKIEYTSSEIRDLLLMVEHGNKSKTNQKGYTGFTRTISAFGILGFVRFMEGYYIILITKRRRACLIGHHTIYKVEETCMYYIPNDAVRCQHPDESRYVRIFQNVDLSSNFYYSYSYDLTHTLQYNMAPPPAGFGEEQQAASGSQTEESGSGEAPKDELVGFRWRPCLKYVWNRHLLSKVMNVLHSDWLLYMIHGYVEQSNISIFGRPVHLALVARRSNKFAGTRFLKRGATAGGHVANEVETEQIVFDASVASFRDSRFSSFVQLRGSIPFFWSQDIAKMVPKPPIVIERADPFCVSAGRHFNQIFMRSGSPIVVLNLIKKREKRKHESILSEHFVDSIQYLNMFLRPQYRIVHIGFDMARAKDKDTNVLSRLADIAYDSVKKIGIFYSKRGFYSNELRPDPRWKGLRGANLGDQLQQTGIIRVNCVDCLDRTNTAQFAIGKVALAFQLYALGVLETPMLRFDSDCVRMLEEMYEGHGDTLALQYGGSQLVHRIKTYRKTAPWTSQSRDIVHTLSRYYSNTFSDADKQNAINLFLGVYQPGPGVQSIWEMTTDYYLHHLDTGYKKEEDEGDPTRTLTRWWDKDALTFLPLSCEQMSKWTPGNVEIIRAPATDERLDAYFEYYRPYEFTILGELFSYTMSHSVKDFMPNFTTDFSPFSVRVRPGKRREESGVAVTTNPSVTGQSSSTSSTSSSGDSIPSDDSSSDLESTDVPHASSSAADQGDTASHPREPFTFAKMMPGMKKVYGVELRPPSNEDMVLYRRFVHLGRGLSPPDPEKQKADSRGITLMNGSTFKLDSSVRVTPPTVGRKSKEVYNEYLRRGVEGTNRVAHHSILLYQHYVTQKFI